MTGMTSTVEQAWALPVDIARLGAHLEAYMKTKLRSTIDTLRLCNRFGQGDEGITTLPIELVDHVEQYLVEDERAHQRQRWEWEQACAEMRCKPIDHADEDLVHQTYHEMQEAGDLEYTAEDRLCVARLCHQTETIYHHTCPGPTCKLCATLGPSEPHSDEHVASQYVKVEERLEQLMKAGTYDRFDNYFRHWSDVCYNRRADWEHSLSDGKHDGNDCGYGNGDRPKLLGRLAKVLWENLGLQIRIVRGPWTAAQDGSEQFSQRPATSYLQLPVNEERCDTQAPSDVELARFARAVRVLGLDVVPGAVEMDRSVSNGESNGEGKTQRRAGESMEDINTIRPRLLTFCKFADEGHDTLKWAFNCPVDLDYEDGREPPDDGAWMWAVVKD